MTKTEQAALEELHTTPEELAQKTARMEALTRGETQPIGFASTQAQQIDNAVPVHLEAVTTSGLATTPTRKTRSDKDTKKAPKPQPGAISQEQANTLRKLIEDANRTREEYAAAQDAADRKQERMAEAEAALSRYVDALAGK